MNDDEEYLTVRAQEQTEYESWEYLDDELTAIYNYYISHDQDYLD